MSISIDEYIRRKYIKYSKYSNLQQTKENQMRFLLKLYYWLHQTELHVVIVYHPNNKHNHIYSMKLHEHHQIRSYFYLVQVITLLKKRLIYSNFSLIVQNESEHTPSFAVPLSLSSLKYYKRCFYVAYTQHAANKELRKDILLDCW